MTDRMSKYAKDLKMMSPGYLIEQNILDILWQIVEGGSRRSRSICCISFDYYFHKFRT